MLGHDLCNEVGQGDCCSPIVCFAILISPTAPLHINRQPITGSPEFSKLIEVCYPNRPQAGSALMPVPAPSGVPPA